MRQPIPWLPIAVIVLGVIAGVTAAGWFMSRGSIKVLKAQVEVLEDSTVVLTAFVVTAQRTTDSLHALIPLMEAEAEVAVVTIQTELSVQEAEGEAAFRRAAAFLENNPLAQRLVEEMDAEFRVQGMVADEALAVSAAQLLIAQNQIRSMQVAALEERGRRDDHDRIQDARESLKDQIIAEQGRALNLSFFPNLFKNAELAVVAAVVGGAITYIVVKP